MSFLSGGNWIKELPEYPDFLNAYIRYRKMQYRAHRAVTDALKNGDMKPPTLCERCKSPGRPEAHHPNYRLPLDVVWLCHKCHVREHIRLGRHPKFAPMSVLSDAWIAGAKYREAARA